ncbi:hypothetical protein Tco_0711783, partial [Tanacetum coccineum]
MEVATNGASNDRREGFDRSRKNPSWNNNKGQKNIDRFFPYRRSNHGLLSNLSKSLKEILATKKEARTFEPPPCMLGNRRSRDMTKYCHFHEDHGHDTNDFRELRHQIEEAVKSGQLSHLVKGIQKGKIKASNIQQGERKKEDKDTAPVEAPIFMISRRDHTTKRKSLEELTLGFGEITFPPVAERKLMQSHLRALLPKAKAFHQNTHNRFQSAASWFSGEHSWPIGEVPLEITI